MDTHSLSNAIDLSSLSTPTDSCSGFASQWGQGRPWMRLPCQYVEELRPRCTFSRQCHACKQAKHLPMRDCSTQPGSQRLSLAPASLDTTDSVAMHCGETGHQGDTGLQHSGGKPGIATLQVFYLDALALNSVLSPRCPSILHEGLLPLASQGNEGSKELRPAALVLLPPLEHFGQGGLLPMQQTQTHSSLMQHIQPACPVGLFSS